MKTKEKKDLDGYLEAQLELVRPSAMLMALPPLLPSKHDDYTLPTPTTSYASSPNAFLNMPNFFFFPVFELYPFAFPSVAFTSAVKPTWLPLP